MAAARAIDSRLDENTRLIVCSHSCDLQRMQGSTLVVAQGACVTEANGVLTRGRSIKTLQMRSKSGRFVNYDIESIQIVDAAVLDEYEPWRDEEHDCEDREALALWLAQRFDRIALPDAISNAIKESGVEKALDEALQRTVREILEVRVHLDEDATPPALSFLLVYDAGEPDGLKAAKAVAAAVEKRAGAKAQALDGRVTFAGALPVSDVAFTYALFRKTKQWRADHISLRATPTAERTPQ